MESIQELILEFLRSNAVGIEESEEVVRGLVQESGASALGQRWTQQAREGEPKGVKCSCGRSYRVRRNYRKRLVTLLGATEVERSYYWCPKCREGRVWLDERLGCRGRSHTGKVQECVAMAVASETYLQAKRLLESLAGLNLSHYVLEEIAEQLGSDLGKERQDMIEQAEKDELNSEERSETLVVQTDGVFVRTREGWQEAKTVAAFPHDIKEGGCEPEPGRISYSSRVEDCEQAGRRMYAEACRRGLKNVRRVAIIGDGAEWIWNQSALHFPKAIEIVDWYHATQHLWEVANALFGEKSIEGRQWEQQQEAWLWDGEVDEVLREMQRQLWSRRKTEKRFKNSERESILQRNLGYFTRHKKRMDYARFRKDKLPIGSGVVESSCKHYVGQRCDRSGMRWNHTGLHAILELRSALVSDEWDRVQKLFKAA